MIWGLRVFWAVGVLSCKRLLWVLGFCSLGFGLSLPQLAIAVFAVKGETLSSEPVCLGYTDPA